MIAEDPSDVEALSVLVRRLSHYSTMPLKGKGYGGCGEMLRKGAGQLRLFRDLGCKRFIICYDADGPRAKERQLEIIDKIIKPSGLPLACCLPLVPVQEIEAWVLADIHQAVPKVIPSWRPDEIPKPESISSPKEHLTQLSRGSNKKPRYAYTVHNPQVAKYLDIGTVEKKCPSFRPLVKFVAGFRRIQPPSSRFPGTGGRSLWIYIDPSSGVQYVRQLATASDWGQVTNHVQALDDPPQELTRLCEYGWAELAFLEEELDTILALKPKAGVRSILTILRTITTDRGDARFLGLDDGTR